MIIPYIWQNLWFSSQFNTAYHIWFYSCPGALQLDALSDFLCTNRLGCIDNDADFSVADIANQLDHVLFLLSQLHGNHGLLVIFHLTFLRPFIDSPHSSTAAAGVFAETIKTLLLRLQADRPPQSRTQNDLLINSFFGIRIGIPKFPVCPGGSRRRGSSLCRRGMRLTFA